MRGGSVGVKNTGMSHNVAKNTTQNEVFLDYESKRQYKSYVSFELADTLHSFLAGSK